MGLDLCGGRAGARVRKCLLDALHVPPGNVEFWGQTQPHWLLHGFPFLAADRARSYANRNIYSTVCWVYLNAVTGTSAVCKLVTRSKCKTGMCPSIR